MKSQNQLSRPQSTRHRSGISFLLAAAMTALLAANIGFAQADIACAKPVAGGVYNAGDIMTLDWTSSGSGATFSNLQSMTATLVCNDGLTIATLPITDWTLANNWTVPSVGNATVAGGTTGTCTGNLFHVNYGGTYAAIPFFPANWGPVSCGTVTILPSPNNTLPTTTTVTFTTIAVVTSTAVKTSTSTKGQTSSSTPTPTPTPTNNNADKDSSSGPSTTTIVVVAIVAGVILILLAFGTVWYHRRQKRRRMENAIMPWSNQQNNNFAKISSSTDDGPRSFGASAAAIGAGAYGAGKNKPLPPTGAYYEDDGYGYNNAHSQSPPQGYRNYHQGYEGYDQQGYEGYPNEDEYYNPYYAQGGATPGSPAHRGPGGAYYNGGGQQGDLYGVSSAVSPRVAGASGAGGGYFPPPPPTSATRSPAAIPANVAANSSLNSLPLTSSTTMLTSSSSTRRAPQLIVAPTSEGVSSKVSGVSSPTLALASGGAVEEEQVGQDKGIPMQNLPPSSSPR